MDKPPTRKLKTLQIKYPAPYSRSWSSPTRKADKPKKKAKKNSASLEQTLIPGCCRRAPPTPLPGTDPYAPHLKYGIFPQYAQKAKSPATAAHPAPAGRPEHTAAKGENKWQRSAQPSDTPLFVIRPIDKRHRRHLSTTETLHLDIKPRRNMPQSPIRTNSPTFKKNIHNTNKSIELT